MSDKHHVDRRTKLQRTLMAVIVTSLTMVTQGCATPSPTPDPIAIAMDAAADHILLGQYSAAETLYLDALTAEKDVELALALADLYAAWSMPQQGLHALNLARGAGAPKEALVSRELTLAAMAGDWDLVAETALASLAVAPEDPQALNALLEAQLQRGTCSQAADTARRLLAADATISGAAERLYLLEGDYATLQAEAPRLMSGLETCGDACDRQIGLRLVRAERWGEAVCLLERAVSGVDMTSSTLDTDTASWLGETYAWLGEAESRTGHPLDAERHLRTAVELAPASPPAWLLLGKQRLERGDLETARIALLNAQRLDPANPAPCLAMAELKAQAGVYTEVDRWINAALERAPQDAGIWKAAARFYLTRDLTSLADPAPIIAQAITLAPDDGEAHLLQGWHALVKDDPETGLQALDLALSLDPNQAEGHYLRSLALEAMGRTTDAKIALTRAADLGWHGIR